MSFARSLLGARPQPPDATVYQIVGAVCVTLKENAMGRAGRLHRALRACDFLVLLLKFVCWVGIHCVQHCSFVENKKVEKCVKYSIILNN